MIVDTMAFDAKSVRSIDSNGFMHIKYSPFTKEQVAPYYGREIPGWEAAGLQADKTYYGYRSAEELSKPETVESLNGIPVQFRHHPDFADAPAKETRVGAAGTDAEWKRPYLFNSMTIYDDKAKSVINNGFMRELSLAYQYKPEFKKGTFDGKPYDFIMRNIRANHIALVEEGRAGKDVLVYDSKPIPKTKAEVKNMDEKEILKNAATALQALLALQKKSEDTLDGAVDGIIGKLGDRVTEDEKKEIRDSIMALGEKFKGDACKDEKPEELKDEEETEETAEVETEETEKPELVEGVESAEGESDDDDDETEAEAEITEKVKAEDGDIDETAEVETETEKVKDTDARMDKLIQDAIKACGLENEDDVVKNAFIAGIKYGDQSGKAMAHDSVNGYSDALDAYDMITAEVKERMNAIAEAAEDVKGVLGKIKATAYDAAEEVYLDACKQLGINCNRLTARDAFMAYNAGHKKQLATDSKPATPAKQTILGSVLDRVRID
jgi:hypothetical protein